MLCFSRDDVLEEGVNVWAGEETPSFKPKADIVLVHGLGSHPYWAWFQDPSLKIQRASSSPHLISDSTLSLVSTRPRLSSICSIPENAAEDVALLSSPDLLWTNDYSQRDMFGKIGTFWPRDLLGSDITDVRICTVGYKSQWVSSRFSTNFQECGEHILTVLEHSRSSNDARQRPIIFIAHSFGGLVVQSALITARLETRFENIAESVAGCLFLGSPFHGTNAVSLLSMATSLGGNSQEILDSLKPGNLDLQLLQEQFRSMYSDLPIICFYETIKSGLRRSLMIVPRDAACLSYAKRIALHRDHSGLVKYRSHTDESYLLLRAELKEMLKSIRRNTNSLEHGHRRRRGSSGHIREQLKNLVPDKLKANRRSMLEGSFSEIYELPARPAHGNKERLREFAIQEFPGRPPLDDPYGIARGQDFFVKPVSNRFDPILPNNILGQPCAGTRHSNFPNPSPSRMNDRGQVAATRSSRLGVPPIHRKQIRNGAQQHTRPGGAHRTATSRSTQQTEGNPGPDINGLASHVEESSVNTNLPPHLRKSFEILRSQLQMSVPSTQCARITDSRIIETSERYGKSPPQSNVAATSTIDRVIELEAEPHPTTTLPNPKPSRSVPISTSFAWQPNATSNLLYDVDSLMDPGTPVAPLKYLRHVEQIISDYCDSSAQISRGDLLDRLAPNNLRLMPAEKVALTGCLGAGKTYVAIACVRRLMRQCPSVSIFWVAADLHSQMLEDCMAIENLLALSPSENNATSSGLLLNIWQRLSDHTAGPWLLVVDGLNDGMAANLEIPRLSNPSNEHNGYVLMTTRRLDVASRFASCGGLTIEVSDLDPAYAANLLGSNANTPNAYVYDELARSLEYNPAAVTRVKTFLGLTAMPSGEFAAQLAAMIDESYWEKQNTDAMAKRCIARSIEQDLAPPTSIGKLGLASLNPVVRSCLSPAWFLMFDQLNEEHPAACEVLSTFSAFGRPAIPPCLLSSNAAVRAAREVLLNHSYFKLQDGVVRASRLMLLSHRIWLITRDNLGGAFKSALQMVACAYPDADDSFLWPTCQTLEPFAMAITSKIAESWIDMDDSSRWFRSMLFQKRSKFFRLSGINVWQSKEMDDAEVAELSAIHKA